MSDFPPEMRPFFEQVAELKSAGWSLRALLGAPDGSVYVIDTNIDAPDLASALQFQPTGPILRV